MQITTVLDVAIGLAFTFFMLAMLTSGVQELIAGWFRWRGTYLTKAIEVILSNEPKAAFAWQGVDNFLKAHFTTGAAEPLESTQELNAQVAAIQKIELPARSFFRLKAPPTPTQRAAAPSTVEDAKTVALAAFQKTVADHPLLTGTPSQLPSYVSAHDFGTAILNALRDGSQMPLFSQAESVIAKLPNGQLRTLLTDFVEEAGGDLDKLRAIIEQWFDDAMDRAQGIYKRYVQWFLLAIGLVAAIVFNVDTFKLASDLWLEPPSAAAIAAYETTATAINGETDPSSRMTDVVAALRCGGGEGLPIGWVLAPDPPAAGTATTNSSAGAKPCTAKPTTTTPATSTPAAGAATPNPATPVRGWWWHIPGWLVTAFAVSLGAPFWFQLLNNFVNLRNSGAKPDNADGTKAS